MQGAAEILTLAFIVGLTGAVAPGPTLIATIQCSVRGGWTMGPKVTLGHMLLETAVFVLVLFGVSTTAVASYARPIALIGGIALIAFGILTVHESRQASLDQSSETATGNPYLAGLVTCGTNPYFWIWWLTVGGAFLLVALEGGVIFGVIFMIGHWAADAGWYTVVAAGIHRGRSVLSERGYRTVLVICGAFLICFGGYYLVGALPFGMN